MITSSGDLTLSLSLSSYVSFFSNINFTSEAFVYFSAYIYALKEYTIYFFLWFKRSQKIMLKMISAALLFAPISND